MSNFVERFRQRETLPFEIDVPIDLGHDKFIFKVKRFAQEEINAAKKDAQKDCRERGAEPADLDGVEFFALMGVSLCKYIQRHIKGWTHVVNNGTPPLLFDNKIIADLFAEMNEGEKSAIGMSYLMQLQELNKKKDSSENSIPTVMPGKSEKQKSTSLNASD